jgi:hypothetical protein
LSEQHEPEQAAGQPRWGFTRHGLAVHARVADHHKDGFNKRVAMGLTGQVGSMRTFWYFNVLSLLSLPATLVLVGVFAAPKSGPLHFFLTFGWIYLITWICQNYIQLVLLPALMVGQNLQNAASDARSAKQFEDVEQVRNDLTTALDRLDEKTEGGIRAVLDAVNALVGQAPGKRLATKAERSEGPWT